MLVVSPSSRDRLPFDDDAAHLAMLRDFAFSKLLTPPTSTPCAGRVRQRLAFLLNTPPSTRRWAVSSPVSHLAHFTESLALVREPQAKRVKFDQLQSLCRWRSEGLLDSPDFKAAKRDLLGLD